MKRKILTNGPSTLSHLAARYRWNEHNAVAVGERCRPVAELGIDGDPEHLWSERERIAAAKLRIELARRAGGRGERLLAPPGLLAQHGVILHGEMAQIGGSRRAHGGHDGSILLGSVDVVEGMRLGLIEELDVRSAQEPARTVIARGVISGECRTAARLVDRT